jgi:hypothetical protein
MVFWQTWTLSVWTTICEAAKAAMLAMVANRLLLAASRDPFVTAYRQAAGVESWRSAWLRSRPQGDVVEG